MNETTTSRAGQPPPSAPELPPGLIPTYGIFNDCWHLVHDATVNGNIIYLELAAAMVQISSNGQYRAAGYIMKRMRNSISIGLCFVSIYVCVGCKPSPTVLPHDINFGTGIYLDRTLFDGQRTRDAVKLAAEAGMKWSREEFHWDQIEPERGVSDEDMLARYDRAVGTLRENGLSILGLLAYRTPWSSGENAPATDAQRLDYAHYAAAMVERYHDSVKVWEVWNEPNLDHFWPPKSDPAAYTELLRVTYTAIKESDPTAKVVGCSTSGVDLNFIRSVLDGGGGQYMDILSIHPYSGNQSTDVADEREGIRQLRQMLVEFELDLPIWVSEVGFQTSTDDNGVSEADQGALLVRTYLTLFAEGVDVVINYDFIDDGDDPDEWEQNFGIVHHNLDPKPAYHAIKTAAQMLEGAQFERSVDIGFALEAFEFSIPDGRHLWAIWSSKQNGLLGLGLLPVPQVELPTSETVERVIGLYGQCLAIEPGGTFHFKPEAEPIFILTRP